MRTEQDARRDPRPGDVFEVNGYTRRVEEPIDDHLVTYTIDGLGGLRSESEIHFRRVIQTHGARVLHVAQEGGEG